jgi:hypothetical protein
LRDFTVCEFDVLVDTAGLKAGLRSITITFGQGAY